MNALNLILTIIQVLCGLAVIAVVMLQSGKSAGLSGAPEARIARRIADYIAGMTDTYAVLAHRKLYDVTPELQPSPPSRWLPLAET